MSERPRRLRMGMVGGGRDAFIGAVHRAAARLDGEIELIAGALSSSPEKSLASGRDIGLADDRNYPSWQAMLDGESERDPGDRIDFVSIVTPNDTHCGIASSFADGGFHVICDKPMVRTVEEAEELAEIVRERGVVFCVTYNYSGYPMVRQARELVRSGALGDVRKVLVEYLQGWLATPLESTGQKQATWRTDPAQAGAGAVGDIGTHAEQIVGFVTGSPIAEVCADAAAAVPDRTIDDDANMLVRLEGGARGVLVASQICPGHRNGLALRVFGSKGSLHWRQESPDQLVVNELDGPERIWHRADPGLSDAAVRATRLPGGHPEAFIEAFANIYRGAVAAMRAGVDDPRQFEYPGIEDGVRGVRFIDAVLRSSAAGQRWTSLAETPITTDA